MKHCVFSDYNSFDRQENDLVLANYYASIFKSQDYFSIDKSITYDRFCLLSQIDGFNVGWICKLCHSASLSDIKGLHPEVDVFFASYPFHADLGEDLIQFSPPSFGYRMGRPDIYEIPWSLYEQLRGSVNYKASGKILFCQKKHFGNDLVYREPLREKLMAMKNHEIDFEITDPETYLRKVSTSKVAVLSPGVGPHWIDRSNVQLMALGCCCIMPKPTTAILKDTHLIPGVHFLECKLDFSDLEELLETPEKEMIQIGRQAKIFFEENLTPQPLRRYVEKALNNIKHNKPVIRSVPQLLDAERSLREHRHVQRYRFARRHCKGSVLDFGSGTGYGSYMLRQNSDISEVVSYDVDEKVVAASIANFGNNHSSINRLFDTIVAMEVIEHLDDLNVFMNVVKNTQATRLIISVPDGKTTHYNRSHKQDFDEDKLRRLLVGFDLKIQFVDDSIVAIADKKGLSLL